MGWLELTGSENVELEVRPQDVAYGGSNTFDLEPLPGDIAYSVDLKERDKRVDVKNAYSLTHNDYKKTERVLNEDDEIRLKMKRSNGSYRFFDGSNDHLHVKCVARSNAVQIDYAGQRFKWSRITFRRSS